MSAIKISGSTMDHLIQNGLKTPRPSPTALDLESGVLELCSRLSCNWRPERCRRLWEGNLQDTPTQQDTRTPTPVKRTVQVVTIKKEDGSSWLTRKHRAIKSHVWKTPATVETDIEASLSVFLWDPFVQCLLTSPVLVFILFSIPYSSLKRRSCMWCRWTISIAKLWN